MHKLSSNGNLIRGHLELVLLSILKNGSKYGLEISKEALERTDGYFELKVGSLYPALHRMERAGLISGQYSETLHGGKAKVYSLTAIGIVELHGKQSEFKIFNNKLNELWEPI